LRALELTLPGPSDMRRRGSRSDRFSVGRVVGGTEIQFSLGIGEYPDQKTPKL